MITVISPAKKLDLTPVIPKQAPTMPEFQSDAYVLSRVAGILSVEELQKLMQISQPLGKLSHDRFKSFAEFPEPEMIKSAILAFNGDTYLGLEAASLDADELRYAQNHLRILSGLYGLLRPLDQIQPYRLEMGSRLATPRGKNLYQYWGDRLALALNELAAENGAEFLLNCASVEYFTAVDASTLKPRIITPVFMETRNGKDKIVSFFAKRARGAMARFVVQNRIETPDGIKDFTAGGYVFQPELSMDDKLIFIRPYPETASS